MKFIHAVVLNYDEYVNGDYDTTNWDDLCDGDYVVHALYSVDNEEVLMLNDNCHSSIESDIEAFLEGIEFCGHDAIVDRACVLMNRDEDAYNEYAVKVHLDNCEYVEVV